MTSDTHNVKVGKGVSDFGHFPAHDRVPPTPFIFVPPSENGTL